MYVEVDSELCDSVNYVSYVNSVNYPARQVVVGSVFYSAHCSIAESRSVLFLFATTLMGPYGPVSP